MKTYKTISSLLIASAIAVSMGQQAIADAGDGISGGGQLLDQATDAKISFGIWANEISTGIFEGELQINFHRVPSYYNKSKFHGNVITEMNFFASNDASCNAALNVTIEGTLDGMSGYSVIFRVGDAGSPGNTNSAEPFDTARIQLFQGDVEVYDTHDGDFADQSTCVGTARTGLDRGNITIERS